MKSRDIETAVWLFGLFATFFYYLFVSLTTPIVFGDEGYYASIGRYMLETGKFPVFEPYHQTDIYKLPFAKLPLYFFFTYLGFFFGETAVKMLPPVFALLAALSVYLFLSRAGFRIPAMAASLALLLLPGVATYGTLNYVEISLILFFTLSVYFSYLAVRERGYAVLSGIFSGLSFLTDLTGAFAPVVSSVFLLSEKRFREAVTVIGMSFVLVLPFLLRNLLLFGAFCLPGLPGDCGPVIQGNIETHGYKADAPLVPQQGTGLRVASFGWLNYFLFAYGASASYLLFAGALNLRNLRRKRLAKILGIWLAVFALVTVHQGFFGFRTEDTVRYTLFGFPALAMSIGLLSSVFRKRAALAALAIVLVLAPYGFLKLTGMIGVKHKLDSVVDACRWIRENTPEDALFYGIYAHQEAYQCHRKVQSVVPDRDIIRMWANETSYEHIKAHGYDYIIVELFTLSPVPYGESTPYEFLSWLENSDRFERVYDNTRVFGNSGIVVYRVVK